MTYRGVEVAELVSPDPVRAALWRMVEAGEAGWSGQEMVVPETLPKNTVACSPTSCRKTAGPACRSAARRDVIVYLDTSAFVKLVIGVVGQPAGRLAVVQGCVVLRPSSSRRP